MAGWPISRHLIAVAVLCLVGTATAPPSTAESTESARTSYVLRDWARALAGRDASPGTVLAVGDSITEGYNIASPDLRWLNLLQADLRAAFPTAAVGAGGGFGYRPANYTWAGFADPVVVGSVGFAPYRGLGQRTLSIGTGGSVTFDDVVGTTVRVWYSTVLFGSPLEVTIDGGPPVTIPTHVNGQSHYRDRWTDLPTGGSVGSSHTMVFQRGAGGAFPPQLGGIQTFDGDEGVGIHVLDAAHAGWTASRFARGATGSDDQYSDIEDWVSEGAASLVLLALGTNEWQNGIAPAAYAADMQTVIDSLRLGDPTVPVLLVAWQEPDEAYAGDVPWSEYVEVMGQLAEVNPDVALIDLAEGPPIATSEGLHPNAAGNRTIADLLLSVLSSGWTGPDDLVAPSVTISSPADGAAIPQYASLVADFACDDGPDGSGVRRCAADVEDGSTIDTSTLGQHEFTVTATDNAGNLTEVTSNYTVVDVTNPTAVVLTPADGQEFVRNQLVVADYSCSAGSGGSELAGCAGPVADGAPIDTSAVGEQHFSVTASDAAGNEVIVANEYLVLERPRCDGREVTVDLSLGEAPTEGPDTILGTTGSDRIRALGGDDVVCGLGGADTLYLGEGEDAANGGAGPDRLDGGAGHDRLRGGPEGDHLFGRDGTDDLRGRGGDDVQDAGSGDDALFGGAGDDRQIGGPGRDDCDGGGGHDVALQCERRVRIE